MKLREIMNKFDGITLNDDEINELRLEKWALLKAYIYLKVNSNPEEKKTKKILWGNLAVYGSSDPRKPVSKAQAQRMIEKLENSGMISSTDEPQVYKLNLCTTAENLSQENMHEKEAFEPPEAIENSMAEAMPDIGSLFEGVKFAELLSNKGSTIRD
jgi:hypothetical protein